MTGLYTQYTIFLCFPLFNLTIFNIDVKLLIAYLRLKFPVYLSMLRFKIILGHSRACMCLFTTILLNPAWVGLSVKQLRAICSRLCFSLSVQYASYDIAVDGSGRLAEFVTKGKMFI